MFSSYDFAKFFIICLIAYIKQFRIIVIFICYFITGIIVTETFIKSNRNRDIDLPSSRIINFPLIYSSILNYNAFLTTIMHCLAYTSIKNMNITLTYKCVEMRCRWNRFIDSFKRGNAVCTSANSTILDICNYLNNFIS